MKHLKYTVYWRWLSSIHSLLCNIVKIFEKECNLISRVQLHHIIARYVMLLQPLMRIIFLLSIFVFTLPLA